MKNTTVKNMTQLIAADTGFVALPVSDAWMLRIKASSPSPLSHMRPKCFSSIANTLNKAIVVPMYIVPSTTPQAAAHAVAAACPYFSLSHNRASLPSTWSLRSSRSSPRAARMISSALALEEAASAIAEPPAHKTWPTTEAAAAYIAAAAKESGSNDSCTARSSMPTNNTQIMMGNCNARDSANEHSDVARIGRRRIVFLRRKYVTALQTSNTSCSTM
mmetsp:Transcript_23760/g.68406  ORF Transcript_23760/g.68406 Transcript_23760/m.68406 type:complete len:218 (-) Transcript_23760:684-1337(-)